MTDFNFDPKKEKEPQRTRPVVAKLVFGAILTVLFVGFILQNSQDVEVEFLRWTWNIPMSLLLISTSIMAILIWELDSYFRRRRKVKDARLQ